MSLQMQLFMLFLVLVTPLGDDGAVSSGATATGQSELASHKHDDGVSCGVGAAFLLLERLGQPRTLVQIEQASPVAADVAMSLADLKTLFENL